MVVFLGNQNIVLNGFSVFHESHRLNGECKEYSVRDQSYKMQK